MCQGSTTVDRSQPTGQPMAKMEFSPPQEAGPAEAEGEGLAPVTRPIDGSCCTARALADEPWYASVGGAK